MSECCSETLDPKDPGALVDFLFDWKKYLETIGSAVVTVNPESGVIIDRIPTVATSTVTAWLRGGTLFQDATLRCEIITSAGRTDFKTVIIPILTT
jgi:hypothetical protein